MFNVCFFFFSSRRRHTRFDCDWSSDVCSSDLSGRPLRRTLKISLNVSQVAYTLTRPCSSGRPFSHSNTVGLGFGPNWLELMRGRSEEHTSELQSQSNLVCRLLLEKKKPNFTPR